MAKLNLQFVGFKEAVGCIAVNGKLVNVKKNRDKTYSCELEATEAKSEVVIYRSHNYGGKAWFWWNMLYFIISLFGIFEGRQNGKCLVLDAKFNISTEQDTNVIIRRNDFVDGEKLVSIETEAEVEEISNIQYYDKEARKKHAKMKKIKIATAVITVALIVILVVAL